MCCSHPSHLRRCTSNTSRVHRGQAASAAPAAAPAPMVLVAGAPGPASGPTSSRAVSMAPGPALGPEAAAPAAGPDAGQIGAVGGPAAEPAPGPGAGQSGASSGCQLVLGQRLAPVRPHPAALGARGGVLSGDGNVALLSGDAAAGGLAATAYVFTYSTITGNYSACPQARLQLPGLIPRPTSLTCVPPRGFTAMALQQDTLGEAAASGMSLSIHFTSCATTGTSRACHLARMLILAVGCCRCWALLQQATQKSQWLRKAARRCYWTLTLTQ